MQTIAFFNLLQLEKPIRMYNANLWFLSFFYFIFYSWFVSWFLFLQFPLLKDVLSVKHWQIFKYVWIIKAISFHFLYICLYILSLLFADLRFSDILWVTMCLETCFGLCDILTVVFMMETHRFISLLSLSAFFSLQCCRYVWWSVLYSTLIFMHDNTSPLHPRLEVMAETFLLVVNDWKASGG